MWHLQAERGNELPLNEEVERQGTAWRRARRLYAAGYTVTAVQFSVGADPRPLAVYRFDGIRFVRIPKLPRLPTGQEL
jgi:hypothetical protein